MKSVEVSILLSKVMRKEGAGKSMPLYQDLTILADTSSSASLSASTSSSSSSIKKDEPLYSITIHNHYVHQIILQQQQDNGEYESILDEAKVLMPLSYCQEGAESKFTIYTSEFNHRYQHRKPIRFILIQPCSQWIKYEISSMNVQIISNDSSSTSSSLDSISQNIAPAAPTFPEKPTSILQVLKADVNYLKAVPISSVKLVETSTFKEQAELSAISNKTIPTAKKQERDKKMKKANSSSSLRSTSTTSTADYNII